MIQNSNAKKPKNKKSLPPMQLFRSSVRQTSKLYKHVKECESLNILRYESFETLRVFPENREYHIETDKNFRADVEKIANIRRNIILNIFEKEQEQLTDQECDQIDYKARLHYEANVVNTNTREDYEKLSQDDKCKCGCKRGRGDSLGICTDETKLNVLGPGVILMFMFKKSIIINLLMIVLVYGIFSLVTNLMGNTETIAEQCNGDSYCEFKREASDQNKLYPDVNWNVQLWLGFTFSFLWIITLRFIKFLGRHKNRIVDERLRSASDYAIMIQNLPYGGYSEQQLIDYFEGLYDKMVEEEEIQQREKYKQNQRVSDGNEFSEHEIKHEYHKDNRLQMKRIQIIYNMQFSRKMIDQLFMLSIKVDGLLKKIDGQPERQYVKDMESYRKSKNKLKQTYQLFQDLRKKFLNDSQFRKNISTTCCIIEFFGSDMKERLLKRFGISRVGLLTQIQKKIKNIWNPQSKDIIFKGNIIRIQRAPEPSDILWTNCEKLYSFTRKLFIYFVTFLIIMISFGILTGLEYAQIQVAENKSNISDDQTIITVINIAMSVALLIVNQILWLALFHLLDLEYNHTLTEKIISQMNKVLFASSINVIVLPIISNYVLSNKVYAVDGLSGLVFDYHISVIAGLIAKLLDPLFFIKRFVIEVRCLRYLYIRWTCSKLPKVNPKEGVNEVNKFYEGSYFDVAETYVYLLGAGLHAAFFCQLQPFILFLVTLMVAIFYFINKIKILKYSKIPEITELLVFETAVSQAGMVPVMYGVGSIVIMYMESTIHDNLLINYVPSAICIFIGLIGIFNPKDFLNTIIGWIIDQCEWIKKLVEDDSAERRNHPTNQVAQTLNEETEETTRVEVYTQNSNALTLLGFEKVLQGKSQKSVMTELEQFCESFFPNDLKKQALTLIGNKFNKQTSMNLFGGALLEAKKQEPMKEKYREQIDEESSQQKPSNLPLISNMKAENDDQPRL